MTGPCRTCQVPLLPRQRVRGECHACAGYRWRTGRERPGYLFGAAPRCCQICGFPTKPGQGRRCRACAQYYWRHARQERPACYWNPRGGLGVRTA